LEHLALAGRAADRSAGIRTKKLRNIGADLGGAVRGFKDGMKTSEADKQSESGPSAQLSGRTIEGEIKDKAKT